MSATPLAKAVSDRRQAVLRQLDERGRDPAYLTARNVARQPYGEARRLAGEAATPSLHYVVSGAADDSFCDVDAAEEKLLAEGWQPDGPPLVCSSTGMKVKIYRR